MVVPAGIGRLAAPAAFLLAVTLAVLLVRPLLGDDGPTRAAATASPAPAAQQPATRRPAARKASRPAVPAAFYEIRAGDTLGAVAARHDTSVETLVGLNPGVDPTALQVGQRIRVK